VGHRGEGIDAPRVGGEIVGELEDLPSGRPYAEADRFGGAPAIQDGVHYEALSFLGESDRFPRIRRARQALDKFRHRRRPG
jgi:hypothetical protein